MLCSISTPAGHQPPHSGQERRGTMGRRGSRSDRTGRGQRNWPTFSSRSGQASPVAPRDPSVNSRGSRRGSKIGVPNDGSVSSIRSVAWPSEANGSGSRRMESEAASPPMSGCSGCGGCGGCDSCGVCGGCGLCGVCSGCSVCRGCDSDHSGGGCISLGCRGRRFFRVSVERKTREAIESRR